MKTVSVSRRAFLKSSKATAVWLALSPAIVGRAQAATTKLKCSSSLPNDPKYADGRVYYDNLVRNLKANGLGEQIEVAFFPDNQLGQEIDVINSVKLGVIDLMVSGSSISANLVPLVGTFDLGYLFSSFPQQTKAFDAGAARPIEEALLKGASIRIISWAYNFGSRSVLAKKPVKTPEDLAGLKIRTLPNPVITECLRLMGAAATPLAFGEIYTALQAGVLDGLEHDPPTILASKLYETSTNYALTQQDFSTQPKRRQPIPAAMVLRWRKRRSRTWPTRASRVSNATRKPAASAGFPRPTISSRRARKRNPWWT